MIYTAPHHDIVEFLVFRDRPISIVPFAKKYLLMMHFNTSAKKMLTGKSVVLSSLSHEEGVFNLEKKVMNYKRNSLRIKERLHLQQSLE